MAYVISDECVSCGSCADVCPADAISEGDGKYVIDADACLECGTCEAECPNDAIRGKAFKHKRHSPTGLCLFLVCPQKARTFCEVLLFWVLLVLSLLSWVPWLFLLPFCQGRVSFAVFGRSESARPIF